MAGNQIHRTDGWRSMALRHQKTDGAECSKMRQRPKTLQMHYKKAHPRHTPHADIATRYNCPYCHNQYKTRHLLIQDLDILNPRHRKCTQMSKQEQSALKCGNKYVSKIHHEYKQENAINEYMTTAPPPMNTPAK